MLWPDRHIHTQNNPLSMLTQAMHLVARRSPVICSTVRASIRGRNSQTTNRIDIRMPHTPSQQDIQAHHLHLVREEVLIMERLVSLLCHRTRLVSSSRTPNKHLSTGIKSSVLFARVKQADDLSGKNNWISCFGSR